MTLLAKVFLVTNLGFNEKNTLFTMLVACHLNSGFNWFSPLLLMMLKNL